MLVFVVYSTNRDLANMTTGSSGGLEINVGGASLGVARREARITKDSLGLARA